VSPFALLWAFFLFGALAASPRWVRAALPSENAPPTPAERSQAKTRYNEGAAAYRSGRYARAVELFLAADALAPSAALSFNVALAYDKLGETAKALRYYRDYLRRAPGSIHASEAGIAVATLETRLMQRGLQQVTVVSRPSAELSIDGLALGRTPWTGELVPGPHRAVLTRESYSAMSRDFELRADRALDLVLELAPAVASTPSIPAPAPPAVEPARPTPRQAPVPPKDESVRSRGFGPWPWVTLAVGGVGLASAGILELSRRSAEDDARNADDQLAYADRLEAMHGRQTAARVLLGVGVGLVAIGATLVVVDLGSDNGKRKVSVACAPNACVGALEVSIR